MTDTFESYKAGLESPATRHFAITPSDSEDMAIRPRALYVDAGGTAVITDEDGIDVAYTLIAGVTFPFRGVRIKATGTTATLVGWY